MFLFFCCSRQVIAHTQLIVIINILIVSENAIRTQADEIRLSADALIVFVNDNKRVMSEKVCKILLVLSPMLGVPQAWGKFVMLISLCHFT